MSHKPMVHSEKPVKTRTLDLMHKMEMMRRDTSKTSKPVPLSRIPPIGPVKKRLS